VSGWLTFWLALDYLGAALIFQKFRITISSMTWMVAEQRDAPLKLWRWQTAFLRWLGPRLGKDHREGARQFDLAGAKNLEDWLSTGDELRARHGAIQRRLLS
jgi:hypothetical protein